MARTIIGKLDLGELPDTPEVNKKLQDTIDMYKQFVDGATEVCRLARVFQDRCTHDWFEIIEPNPNYFGAEARARGISKGWQCTKCKLFRE